MAIPTSPQQVPTANSNIPAGPHATPFSAPPAEVVIEAQPDEEAEEILPTLELEAEDSADPLPDAVEEPLPHAVEEPLPHAVEEPLPRSFTPIPIPEPSAVNEGLALAPTWEFVDWQRNGTESEATSDRPMIPLPEGGPTNEVPLASTLESIRWQPNAPGLQTVVNFWDMCVACHADEEIAMATLEYCSKRFSRGAYLVSRFGVATVWRGFNLGENATADTLRIDLAIPSIVQAAHNGGMAVASPTPQTPMDQWIWHALIPQNGLVVVKLAFSGNTDYLCVEIGSRSMVDVQQELMEVQQIAVEAQLRLTSSRNFPGA
jgi:hypothetical protein